MFMFNIVIIIFVFFFTLSGILINNIVNFIQLYIEFEAKIKLGKIQTHDIDRKLEMKLRKKQQNFVQEQESKYTRN